MHHTSPMITVQKSSITRASLTAYEKIR